MAELILTFRLPIAGAPRARFVSDYSLRGGRLWVEDRVVLVALTPEALAAGCSGRIPGTPHRLELRGTDPTDVVLCVDGAPAPREDQLTRPASRSAWLHAFQALSGSLFGFVAGWLYLVRARVSADPWAMKMAWHMAAWHLLLTVTLFPASVWGQRLGIRIVQVISAVFFAIHLGIAVANAAGGGGLEQGGAIAVFNALSAVAFGAAAVWGSKAHADMDPAPQE